MSATTTGRATDQAIAKIKELISSGEFTAAVFEDFLAGRQPTFEKRTRMTSGQEWRRA